MEAAEQSEAEIKFWKTPEMLENLFSRLDLKSTLNLARVMEKESLQGGMTSKVWNKLIRDSCPRDEEGRLFDVFSVDRDSLHTIHRRLQLQEATVAMKNLATILKLMKQPKDLLLDLLDVICERLLPYGPYGALNQLQVACPRHPDPHNISPVGLLLLEEVETVLGTTEQWIQSMEVGYLTDSIISAIGSRMARQQEPVTSIRLRHRVKIETERGARAFHTLMSGQVEQVGPIRLVVPGSLGGAGWEAVAEAMKQQPGLVERIRTSKPSLEEGKKEDIKDIWDTEGLAGFDLCQTAAGVVRRCVPEVEVTKPQDDWDMLEKILDMNQAELAAKIKEEVDKPGEEDENANNAGEEDEEVEEKAVLCCAVL